VQTYRPEQWLATIRFMYDNVTIPRQAPRSNEQPMRSRPAILGSRVPSATSPEQRLAQHMEAMGL
jgi:hypothetical protein